MFFYKFLFVILFIFKTINADLMVCDHKECQHAELVSLDALVTELNTIKELNLNNAQLLKDLNEKLDKELLNISCEIENIKESLHEKQNKSTKPLHTEEKQAASATECAHEIENSLYNNSWVVIQRRQDGSIDFFRNWTEYQTGFGDPLGEFFVGLEKIHKLTNYREHELLIILEDFDGNLKYAHYDEFRIGNETHRYILEKLGKYYGTAGDYLRLHKNRLFSTRDRDNDDADNGNCAEWFKGAWWYYHCMTSNLNGPYRHSRYLNDADRGIGITWGAFDEIKYSLKTVQMMLRAKKA